MEAWRQDLYRTQLVHHGIKGQQWGKKNGPPYPLDPEDHSAHEEKMNWQESIEGFIKKYGSGSSESKSEYSDDLDKKHKEATWKDKVDSRLNKVAKNFNVSKDDLVNEYVKSSDTEKFLNVLSKSGAISEADKDRLSKAENKEELESMRKTIIEQYDEQARRAAEKAASKGSSGKKGSSGSGKAKKASTKKEEKKKKEEPKDTSEEWEKPLYSSLTRLMSKNNWSYNDLIKNVINSYGKDKNGKEYDEFLAYLGNSGAFTKEEWRELSKNSERLSAIRKKVLSYVRGLRDYSKEVDSKKKPEDKKKSTTLAHSGKGHDDNPPGRGSGRYPYGSGKKWEKVNNFAKESSFYKAKTMSDADLNSAIKRLKNEQEYIRLAGSNVTDGRNFVEAMMVRFGTETVTTFVDTMAAKTGAGAAVKLFNAMKNEALPKENKKEKKSETEESKSESKKEEPKNNSKPDPKKEEPKSTKKMKISEAENNALNKDLQETVNKKMAESKTMEDARSKLYEDRKKMPESFNNDKFKKTVDDFSKEAKRLNEESKESIKKVEKKEKINTNKKIDDEDDYNRFVRAFKEEAREDAKINRSEAKFAARRAEMLDSAGRHSEAENQRAYVEFHTKRAEWYDKQAETGIPDLNNPPTIHEIREKRSKNNNK